MNVLNKYLPENFPHFKGAPEPNAAQMARIQPYIISLDQEGEIISEEDHSTLPLAQHTFEFLYEFANISGRGKKQEFIHHGSTPLKFEVKEFVRTYAPKVHPEQMREMLAALQVDDDTARKYCKTFISRFKISYRANFITRIKDYSKTNPKIGVISFKEIEDLFHIFPKQLNEWRGDNSLQKHNIVIHTTQKKVTFPDFR